MYLWELVVQFFHDMRSRKLRTALALFGIAWGTISVILLLAIGDAFHAASSKAFHGMGDSIVIVWPGSPSPAAWVCCSTAAARTRTPPTGGSPRIPGNLIRTCDRVSTCAAPR